MGRDVRKIMNSSIRQPHEEVSGQTQESRGQRQIRDYGLNLEVVRVEP